MAFYRGTVIGHMVNGEEWNFTTHVVADTGLAASIASEFGDALTAMWSGSNTPAGNLVGRYPASMGVDLVKVDELTPGGKNLDQALHSMALVGTSTDEALPQNCAIRVTTRTALPNKTGIGGFSLPSPVVSVLQDQQLTSSDQTAIRNAAKAYLQDLKDAGFIPVVYHRGSDAGTEITIVDVGSVPDVMNSRRNQTPEVRSAIALS